MKRLLLATTVSLLPLLPTSASPPLLSEILASNDANLQDEDGEFHDWLELHNPTSVPIALEAYALTDDPAEEPTKWAFPERNLLPGEYLIIFASGKDRRDPAGNLHTNFRLNAGGETIALFFLDEGTLAASVTYPPLSADHTYGMTEPLPGSPYALSNRPTPGAPNHTDVVVFSTKGQAFTDSLTLELSSPGRASIRYTENGKAPTLFNGKTYTGPITIQRTSLIAARAGDGLLQTEVFIQIDPELAERSSDIPLVIADASAALSQTELKEMAFAIIEPSGADGRASLVSPFQLGTRGGIRTRGETSNSFPKKPLRLEFWDTEGEDRDLAPLGMPAESDWILNARYTFDRTLMHNAWIYELSNQLGHWAPHTRFVELYLNDDPDGPVSESDYQGIYTFMETISRGNDRVDIERMAPDAAAEPEITGGYLFKKDKTDPGTWNFNGGSEGLQMIEPPEEGKDERAAQAAWLSAHLDTVRDAIREHGSDPAQGYPAYIDVETWLDHHQLNFLPNNVDALRLSAYFHKPREGRLVAGPVWDFDRSAGGTGDGRITDPLQWGDGSGGTAFFVRGNHGTPVWWEDLFATPDFMQAWVDRWYELRQNERVTPTWDPGAEPLPAFSEANINRIFDHMAAEIMEAQERNFAKWPGARPRTGSQLRYSEQDGFPGEIEHIKGWLAARMQWVEEEFITVPGFSPDGQVHAGGPITLDVSTGGTLFKPAVVYYTTDGSDPRAPGGSPSTSAVKLQGDITLTESTRLFARRVDDAYDVARWGPALQWSGPANRYHFIDTVPAGATNLVVSEIMYHPGAPTPSEMDTSFTDQDDFEFIELLNISEGRVDLTETRLRGSADFDFADGTVLKPGERLVLVSNRAAFTMRYGDSVPVHGEYRDRLGNGSGTVRLRGYDGTAFRDFTYADVDPWPEAADGEGVALVLRSPGSNPDPAVPSQWTAGATANGTPGTAEPGEGGGGSGGREALDAWLRSQLTETQLADPALVALDGDVDGDGLPTLAEFLVGGVLLTADAGRLPRMALIAENRMTLSYPVSEHARHLEVRVEGSADLVEWNSLAGEMETEAGLTTVTLDRGGSVRFLRLRVTLRE